MEYNDYELVLLAQEGNEDASNLIYQKYKPIVVKKSKNAIIYATHHGIEISDIMQEGYIGLEEAIKSFLPGDNKATFYTFANLCIDRKIVNYLRKSTKGKEKVLNNAIAIDENMEKVIKDNTDIEKAFLLRDYEEKIIEKIRKELTEFELKVFELKIRGYDFLEIANSLNKDVKSIYNTFHRIKIKIKKVFEVDN